MAHTPQWLADLVPASFRGIEFKSRGIKETGGRNGPDNEYPESEDVFADDTGRKIKRWTFDAIVIGDNYRATVDALVAAVNSKGEGTLVHPFVGALVVQLRTYELSETTALGGMAEFSITCVEKGKEPSTVRTRDQPGARVNSVATRIADAVAADTNKILPDASDPGFVRDEAVTQLVILRDSVFDTLALPNVGLPSDIPAVQEALDIIGAAITTTAASNLEALRLAYDVYLIVNSIEFAISVALGLFSDDALGAGEVDPRMSDDPATQDAINIAESFTRFRVRLAITAAAVIATRRETVYDTVDDANTTRDRIVELMDAEEFTPFESAESYSLFIALRASFVLEMQRRALLLPQVVEIEIVQMTTAHQIVWDNYADATRIQEFMDRNGLINALFVPPGTYEILQ